MKNRFKSLQDRSRMASRGGERAFPGTGTITRSDFHRPRKSSPDVAETLGRAQKVSAAARKRNEEKLFDIPEDQRGPPKQGPSPTFKELSKAFKMRAAGKTSREIHDAFPHINMITVFMNKAKDHPDYCQSNTGVLATRKPKRKAKMCERTIMRTLSEAQWRVIRRSLESRIHEIYNWRETHYENADIVAECDREMEACYELIEELKK